MFIIVMDAKDPFTNKPCYMYLGWQEPGWDDDGYFWTWKGTFMEIIVKGHHTPEHPFLFATANSALQQLKRIKNPHKCRIIEWNVI